MPLFMPLFNIAVGFGSLLQGKAFINFRLDLPRFDKLFDGN